MTFRRKKKGNFTPLLGGGMDSAVFGNCTQTWHDKSGLLSH